MIHNVHTAIRKNVAYLGANAALKNASKLRDVQPGYPPLGVVGWRGDEFSDKDLIGFKMRR